MQELLLGLLLLLMLAWLVMRIRSGRVVKTQAQAQAPKKLTDTSPFHAVSIKTTEKACVAAGEISGKRFLSSAAPRLPLPGCDVRDCQCRFVHHKDRRNGKDRRSPFAPGGFGAGTGSFPKERRERLDRRKEDDIVF